MSAELGNDQRQAPRKPATKSIRVSDASLHESSPRRSALGLEWTTVVNHMLEADPSFSAYGNGIYDGYGLGIGEPCTYPDHRYEVPEGATSRLGYSQYGNTQGTWNPGTNVDRSRPVGAIDCSRTVNIMEEGGPDGYDFARMLYLTNQETTTNVEVTTLHLTHWHHHVMEGQLQYGAHYSNQSDDWMMYRVYDGQSSSVALAILDKDAPATQALCFYAVGSDVFVKTATLFTARRHEVNHESWAFGWFHDDYEDASTRRLPVSFSSAVSVGTCDNYNDPPGNISYHWRNALYAVNCDVNKVLLIRLDGGQVFGSVWTIDDDGIPTRVGSEQELEIGLPGGVRFISQLVARDPNSVQNTSFVFGVTSTLGASGPVRVDWNPSSNALTKRIASGYPDSNYAHFSWVDDRIIGIFGSIAMPSGEGSNSRVAKMFDADTLLYLSASDVTPWPDLTPFAGAVDRLQGPFAGIGLPGNRWLVCGYADDGSLTHEDTGHSPYEYLITIPQHRMYVLNEAHDGLIEIDNHSEQDNTQTGMADLAIYVDDGASVFMVSTASNEAGAVEGSHPDTASSWYHFFVDGVGKEFHDYCATTVGEWIVMAYFRDVGWHTYLDPSSHNDDSRWYQALHINRDGEVDIVGRVAWGGWTNTFYGGICGIGDNLFVTFDNTPMDYAKINSCPNHIFPDPSNWFNPYYLRLWEINEDTGDLTVVDEIEIADPWEIDPALHGPGTIELARVEGSDVIFGMFLHHDANDFNLSSLNTTRLGGITIRVDTTAKTLAILNWFPEIIRHAKFPGFGDNRNPHQIVPISDSRLICTYTPRLPGDVLRLRLTLTAATSGSVTIKAQQKTQDVNGNFGDYADPEPYPSYDVFTSVTGVGEYIQSDNLYEITTTLEAGVATTLEFQVPKYYENEYVRLMTVAGDLSVTGTLVLDNDDGSGTFSTPLTTTTLMPGSPLEFGSAADAHSRIDQISATEFHTFQNSGNDADSGNYQGHFVVDVDTDTGDITVGNPIIGGDFLGATNFRGDRLNDNSLGYVSYEQTLDYFPALGSVFLAPRVMVLHVISADGTTLTKTDAPLVVDAADVEEWWAEVPTAHEAAPSGAPGAPVRPVPWTHTATPGGTDGDYHVLYLNQDETYYYVRTFLEADLTSFGDNIFQTHGGIAVSPTEADWNASSLHNQWIYDEDAGVAYWVPASQRRMYFETDFSGYPWGFQRLEGHGGQFIFCFGGNALNSARNWAGGFESGWFPMWYRVLRAGTNVRGQSTELDRETRILAKSNRR